MAVQTCNPTTEEIRGRRITSLEPAWATQRTLFRLLKGKVTKAWDPVSTLES